jgi:tetratricopeptide (TPR) repeat protein
MKTRWAAQVFLFLALPWTATGVRSAEAPEQTEAERSLVAILESWSNQSTGNENAVPEMLEYAKQQYRSRGPTPQTKQAKLLRRLADDQPGVYLPVISLHIKAYRLAVRHREPMVPQYLRLEATRLIEEYMNEMRNPEGWRIGAGFYIALAASLGDGESLTLAIALLDAGLDTDPMNVQALHAAAAVREKLGHYSSASALLRRLLALTPDPEAELRLALSQARSGKNKHAEERLESLARGPAPQWIRALAYQEWSQLRMTMGDPRMALIVAREGHESLPQDESLGILYAFMAGPRDDLSRAEILRLTSEPTGTEVTPRGRYNMWPSSITETELVLASMAEAQMPRLVGALRHLRGPTEDAAEKSL